MKKLIILGWMILPFFAFSQKLVNGGFESWYEKIYFENPEGYSTSNSTNGIDIFKNVTKIEDAHDGNYAIKLQTSMFGTDTISGSLLSMGFPYTARPDSLTGYAIYDIKPGDTAIIGAFFMKNSNLVGVTLFPFTGNMSNYTYFSQPILWFLPLITPDTVIVFSFSSNPDKPVPGSILILDDINFKSNSGTVPALPNSSFESWNHVYTLEPEGWNTPNFLSLWGFETSVTKTIDAYEGDYAVLIKSIEVFGDTLGAISNGYFTQNKWPSGGMYLESNPVKLSGYYKYFPVGNDTAFAVGIHYTYKSGKQEIAEMQVKALPPASSYTYFELNFSYDKYPVGDTFNITFLSGNIIDKSKPKGLGSALYLDALELTTQPSGIEKPTMNTFSIYPNPTTGKISINSDTEAHLHITVTDISGKTISRFNTDSGQKLDLSQLNPGIYLIKVNDKLVKPVIITK